MPGSMAGYFLAGLHKTTAVERLRWKGYRKPGSRDDATEIHEFPVRVTDIDLFDHMNNSVYCSVIEDYLEPHLDLATWPLRTTIEHEPPVAVGHKLESLSHGHQHASSDKFGTALADRAATPF